MEISCQRMRCHFAVGLVAQKQPAKAAVPRDGPTRLKFIQDLVSPESISNGYASLMRELEENVA